MKRVIVMCGIPGSGKSTWGVSNYPGLPVVSRDIIRGELGFTSGPSEKTALSKEKERLVTLEERRQIRSLLKEGKDFILDDTNTNPRFRDEMLRYLHLSGASEIIGVNIMTPLDVCIKRRKGQIAADVLTRIWERALFIKEGEVDNLITVEYEGL